MFSIALNYFSASQFELERRRHDAFIKARKKQQQLKRMKQEQTLLKREREKQLIQDRYVTVQ